MFKHGKSWICSIWIAPINQKYLSIKKVYSIAKIVTSAAGVYNLETTIGYICTDGDIGEINNSLILKNNNPKSRSPGWFIKVAIYSTKPICEVFIDGIMDEIYAWSLKLDIECYDRHERGTKSQILKFQAEDKYWWYVDQEEIQNRKLEEEFKKNVLKNFSFLINDFSFEIINEYKHMILFADAAIVLKVGCDFRYTKEIFCEMFLEEKRGFSVPIDYLLEEFGYKNFNLKLLDVSDMKEIRKYLRKISIFLKNNLSHLLENSNKEFMRIANKYILYLDI
jgi:hypothetical protein